MHGLNATLMRKRRQFDAYLQTALEYSRLIYQSGTQVVKMASSLSSTGPLKSANKSRPLRFLCQRVTIFGFIIWEVKLLLLFICSFYNLFLVTNGAINAQPFLLGLQKQKRELNGHIFTLNSCKCCTSDSLQPDSVTRLKGTR